MMGMLPVMVFFLRVISVRMPVGMLLVMVFFRDIQYLWTVFTQLLMYMSAIFYTIDGYSETVRKLFLLNPLYLFIRYFRKIFPARRSFRSDPGI